MLKEFDRFSSDQSGAISAMYAVALFGLIAIAGVSWDYGRMMAMDSELQNAADQAALAAATQLDGRSGAISRAQAAATNYLASASSPWVNITRMANDGEGRPVSDLTFVFYESYNSATDTFGPVATDDDDAKVVQVIVNGREAFFALTPVVGLLSSGDITADAVAGLETAACNVPPLMFCAPQGRNDFPTSADIGTALDLRERPQQTDFFAPGNFDLLQIDYANISPNEQNRTLGLNSDFLGCTGSEISTRPGNRETETRAFNTRFDIYANPLSCRNGGDFCPAEVVRSNLVRVVRVNGNGQNATCANTSGGDLVPVADLPSALNIPNQALPLDDCQRFGLAGCASFGDGNWNVNEYLQNVHNITSATMVPGLDANGDNKVTRFEVYQWERADSSRTQVRELGRVTTTSPTRTTLYCSRPTPTEGTPVIPSATQKDRRIVTVASVDCTNVRGRVNIDTIRWVDLFLLQPAVGASGSTEIFAEIVGPAERPDGGSRFQFYGRNKPVLLR